MSDENSSKNCSPWCGSMCTVVLHSGCEEGRKKSAHLGQEDRFSRTPGLSFGLHTSLLASYVGRPERRQKGDFSEPMKLIASLTEAWCCSLPLYCWLQGVSAGRGGFCPHARSSVDVKCVGSGVRLTSCITPGTTQPVSVTSSIKRSDRLTGLV